MTSEMQNPMFVFFIVSICVNLSSCMVWGPDRGGDHCNTAIKDIADEDRSMIVDNSSTRLHGTWMSQECETRTGPEYVIRKYKFYENGTFLLVRYHYAEDSCSVATHTVSATGVIKLLSLSLLTPGATEARYQLEAVYITPLNRQVAYKLEHRMNVTCTPQAKWRSYSAQLIYEQSPRRFENPLWEGPRHNSLQDHQISRNSRGINCLEQIGIDFGELKLLRVQKKTSKSFVLGNNGQARVELFLGSLPPNVYSRRNYRSTSLQPTALLRSDTINGCPICSAVSRGNVNSPPLLHEAAALPALLGGAWLSSSCESFEGGLWLRRQMRIHPGDKLWGGRWEYFADPQCTIFLYAISGAGSYIQRASRQRRHYDLHFDDFDDEFYNKDSIVSNYDKSTGKLLKRNSPLLTKRSVSNTIDTTETFKNEISEISIRDNPQKQSNYINDLKNSMWKDIIKINKLDNIFEKLFGNLLKNSMTYVVGMKSHSNNSSSNKDKYNISTVVAKNDTSFEKKRRNYLNYMRNMSNQIKLIETFKIDNLLSVKNSKINYMKQSKSKRSLDDDHSYRHFLHDAQPSMVESFTAMLRGNQRRDENPKKLLFPPPPSGITELDLHVAESLLIPGDLTTAIRCGSDILGRHRPLVSWPRSCVPHFVEAPSTLGLKAKVGVNWNGQYTLLLGQRDDNLWYAPLLQCGPTSSHNPELRAHLRRSVGLRYGLISSNTSGNSVLQYNSVFLLQASVYIVYWFVS